jgi:predicted phosphodiesterase
MGKKNRSYNKSEKLPRAPRQAGVAYSIPASLARPVVHYNLDVVGRVGVLSDIHVPFHSRDALSVAVKHFKSCGIKALIVNGDAVDFYAISRYEKNPKQRDLLREISMTSDLFGWLRQELPKIPIIYKIGNHEERWVHWLWARTPEISDHERMGLGAWLELPKHGVELIDDHRAIMAGKLPILHGHEKGKTSSPVNQARSAFTKLLHSVLEGHGHRTSVHAETNMMREEMCCFSTGCLCDLQLDYAVYNKWNHGFATVDVYSDGEYGVQNLRISQDWRVRPA